MALAALPRAHLRVLAARNPGALRPTLAIRLGNLGNLGRQLGALEQALAAAREAAALERASRESD